MQYSGFFGNEMIVLSILHMIHGGLLGVTCLLSGGGGVLFGGVGVSFGGLGMLSGSAGMLFGGAGVMFGGDRAQSPTHKHPPPPQHSISSITLANYGG